MSREIDPSATAAGRWAVFGIAAVAALAGVYARFDGLGDRPLNVDEYYFVRSIEQILSYGVPRFETGGYYTRGILLQYVSALLATLAGPSLVVFRLPHVLLGLGTAVLTFFYARLHLSRELSLLVAAALLVSSWEIEFSRFARMYAGLQFATLVFLLVFHRAWFSERGGGIYWPHAASFLGMAMHQLSVLFCPLLLLPLLVPSLRARFSSLWSQGLYALAGVATTCIHLVYLLTDFRWLGVEVDPYPDGPFGSGGGSGPLRLPASPLWTLGTDVELDLLVLLGAMGAVALYFLWRRDPEREPEALLWLALIAALGHQLALAATLVLLVAVRRPVFQTLRSPRLLRIGGAVALAAVVWLGLALAARDSLDPPGNLSRALRQLLFGFPDVFVTFVAPWRDQLPRLGALLGLCLVAQMLLEGRKPLHELLRAPGAFVFYLMIAMSALDSEYQTTRYSYFFYPAGLVVVAMVLRDAVRSVATRLPLPQTARTWIPVTLFAVAFAATDDFHLQHLTNASSPEIAYRTGRYEKYAAAWYPRPDFETPARALPRLEAGDTTRRVVVLNQVPVPYYVAGAYAVFVPRESTRFVLVSRERGAVDLWSSHPLLSTVDDVRRYTNQATQVWLVRPVDTPSDLIDLGPENVWGDRVLEVDVQQTGVDRRIEAVLVRLRAPDGPTTGS